MSTAKTAPLECAMSAHALISVNLIVGLDGVSIKISFVFGFIAFFTFSISEVSTKSNSTPNRENSFSITTREGA